MQIVFNFDVYFLEQQHLKVMECQKQFFERQWMWLKDISGNNHAVYVCILSLVQFRNFDVSILRHFSVCSE